MPEKPSCEKIKKRAIDSENIVSEFENSDTAVKINQKYQRLLINRVEAGIVVHDSNTRILDCNSKAQELLGLSKEQMLGKKAIDPGWEFIGDDEKIMSIESYPVNRVLSNGQPLRDLTLGVYRISELAPIWLSVSAVPVFDDKENIEQVVVTFVDITDRKKAEKALYESEKRFERMLSVVPDMISIHSPQMDILYSNWKGFAAIPESKRILNTKCYKTYRGFDDICPDCQAQSVLRLRKPVEKEIQLPDGSWFDLRVIPVLDQDSSVEIFMEWVRDITDIKKAEIAIQRQLRFERGIAAASACLLGSNKVDDNVTAALSHLCKAADVDRVYIFKNFHDPEGNLCMRQLYEACALGVKPEINNPDLQHVPYMGGFERWRDELSAGRSIRGHVVHFPDKERKILEEQDIVSILVLPLFAADKWRGFIGFDETRKLREWLEAEVFLLGTAVDLIGGYMALIEAQEAQRASEEKFSKAFHTSPYIITISRLSNGGFIEVNDAFTTVSGYTREEALTNSSLSLNLWVNREDREKIIAKLDKGEIIKDYEAQFRSKSGKTVDALFSAQIIYLNGEKCILSSLNDITDQKRAEEETQRLQKQLAQAQKMESVGRLAGGVAHDFNNMLSVILGYTDFALEQAEQIKPLKNALQEIQKAAQRSADVTRQLLAFARKQTIAPQVIKLNNAVGNMLKMLGRLIGEDIDLVWLPAKNLWSVRMDPTQIDQILVNLCVNARDAIAEVGKITIETRNVTFDAGYCEDHPGFVAGDFILLAVSDDGCGMDNQTINNLFEPFFTTKEVDKGSGLGLATVYGIVKQNNGFINVYSELDSGTTLKIYLPRHEISASTADEKLTETSDAKGNETILLVEDEPAILKMIDMMLKRLGYTVLTALTPGEAIHIARKHAGQIHLLMTDVVMPEMNGRDLARNLMPLYPDLKRLFMSGYTANVIAHRGVLDEGVNFIQKPFSKKDIAAKLREVLDRRFFGPSRLLG